MLCTVLLLCLCYPALHFFTCVHNLHTAHTPTFRCHYTLITQTPKPDMQAASVVNRNDPLQVRFMSGFGGYRIVNPRES